MNIPNSFYLFGKPIQNSKSPQIHNELFKKKKIHYKYSLFETCDPQAIKSSNYLGASVTIPLKEKIIPLLDILSEDVKMLEAANTITLMIDGKLRGDNTDWLAIRDVIKENYKKGKGLVIGTGGTALAAAYSFYKLNIPYDIYGRNLNKCHNIKNKFKATNVVTNFNNDLYNYKIIIICVPPEVSLDFSCIKDSNIIEMAYTKKPNRIYGNNKIITGEDLLYRQAVYQNNLWTNDLKI